MKAKDILPDDQNELTVSGQTLRKGSVAAFIANCKLMQQYDPGTSEYQAAKQDALELYPILQAVGLFDVFDFSSDTFKQIFHQT